MVRGGGTLVALALLVVGASCGATSHQGDSSQTSAGTSSGSGGNSAGGTGDSSGDSNSSDTETHGGHAPESSAGAAGRENTADCPPPRQVRHGGECSLVGTCSGQDTFILELEASCVCTDGHWQCTWPECPPLCMSYGPTCPGGAFPAGCTCTPTPPPPNQNVGGCCCSQAP